MSFVQNKTRIERQKDVENIIAQWPNFDIAYLLNSEMGIPGTQSFYGLLNPIVVTGSDHPFLVHKVGKLSKTLNPYRNLQIINIDLMKISGGNRLNLSFFPFSLVKFGMDGALLSEYDKAGVSGVDFGDTILNHLFCTDAVFVHCQFKGGAINYLFGNTVKISNCHFRNLTMDFWRVPTGQLFGNIFDDVRARHLTITNGKLFVDSTISNSDFSFINADSSGTPQNSNGCTIDNSKFDHAVKFRTRFILGGSDMFGFRPCSVNATTFIGANIDITIGTADIVNCDFTKSKGLLTFASGANVHNCTFDHAVYTGFSFTGSGTKTLTDCDFIKTTFPANVDLTNVDIRGCDFTGSNLNTAMVHADRNALKAAVSAYDADTLWVDGTPL